MNCVIFDALLPKSIIVPCFSSLLPFVYLVWSARYALQVSLPTTTGFKLCYEMFVRALSKIHLKQALTSDCLFIEGS